MKEINIKFLISIINHILNKSEINKVIRGKIIVFKRIKYLIKIFIIYNLT